MSLASKSQLHPNLRAILVSSLLTASLVAGCHGRENHTAEKKAKTSIDKSPIEVQATIDRATATTGDTLVFSVEVDYADNLKVIVPELGSKIAGFRILDFGRDPSNHNPKNGRIVERQWYKLRGDLVGSYILPALSISYQDLNDENTEPKVVETSEIFVEVGSVLPADGSAKDIRALKPLRRVTKPIPWHIYGPILGALIVLIGLTIYWHRRRHRREVQLPAVPPDEIAFAALDSLRKTDFANPREVRRYYFAISEVLRTYIEGRFHLNATDLTTEELMPRLRQSSMIEREHKTHVGRFLTETDAVKFAGVTPSSEDIKIVYEQALTFVEQTKQVLSTEVEQSTEVQEVAHG